MGKEAAIDPGSSRINWGVNPLNSQLSAWKRTLGRSMISLQDQTMPLRASHRGSPKVSARIPFWLRIRFCQDKSLPRSGFGEASTLRMNGPYRASSHQCTVLPKTKGWRFQIFPFQSRRKKGGGNTWETVPETPLSLSPCTIMVPPNASRSRFTTFPSEVVDI